MGEGRGVRGKRNGSGSGRAILLIVLYEKAVQH